jgi:hypothetical protein
MATQSKPRNPSKSNYQKPEMGFLRECFSCDVNNGQLTWLKRPEKHFLTSNAAKIWNAKYPGREAGSREHNGYRQVTLTIYGRQHVLRVHQIIWAFHVGYWPDRVDHRNGDTSEDRISNLREATHAQNMRNKRTQRNNKLGLKGVVAKRNKFEAKIVADGKKIYLGVYATPEEAHEAYRVASIKYHGAFARSS